MLTRGIGLGLALLMAVTGCTSDPATPPVAQATEKQVRVEPRPWNAELPLGGRHLRPDTFFVAYYGTAGTASLGVLGEGAPKRIMPRLRRAARPFEGPSREIQKTFELIVTVADAVPGPDRDFSHDISREAVEAYVKAAHRHRVLLILDLQPGRSDFLKVVRRWRWALKDPWVGLALDPEWRVERPKRPAQVIGHVGAAEVNRVTAWLSELIERRRLPEKVLMLHQFRREMVHNVARVRQRPGLVMIQHVDGFGSPRQKLATFHHVVRPQQFRPGFKLFYDEDKPRMSAKQVLRIRPRVSFVSFQ